MREQLNNNPNGRSHKEALALQDEVTRLNADAQQLRQDLNEAVRSGEITGSDLPKALYDVDDAANRAKNLRPEAARQVQYASPNGQQAREVAELVVPGFGTLTDAKDIAQLLSTGQYGAAAGMTGLAIASIFPPFRAARKVGRTSDAAEDVASAAGRVERKNNTDDLIFRSDNNFRARQGAKRGRLKSYIDDNGNLVPANPNGKATVIDHIRGSEPRKSDSPYTSFSSSQTSGKSYGDTSFSLDVKRLQSDIDNGLVNDVEVVDHNNLLKIHDDAVQKAQIRYDSHPSTKNLERLDAARLSRSNSIRDQEVLVKGIVPSQYLNFK
ncbi:hypothetical protein BFW38_05690 [Terasakiispira papahanaumokuakeensis]|uniref:Uncharacterized protein n=1 Tax=Terasakiispira papahanaumokuakeensis TaxID=197479 RepID=A0A1E2V8D1_9GAMM|nr:hypothetical protein [Terasakiispira papahanaumokuakeensis]ODC03112.1 hypothetical protein BFW38_05690 [Terasakiispira papahanaumokuakeensis]